MKWVDTCCWCCYLSTPKLSTSSSDNLSSYHWLITKGFFLYKCFLMDFVPSLTLDLHFVLLTRKDCFSLATLPATSHCYFHGHLESILFGRKWGGVILWSFLWVVVLGRYYKHVCQVKGLHSYPCPTSRHNDWLNILRFPKK